MIRITNTDLKNILEGARLDIKHFGIVVATLNLDSSQHSILGFESEKNMFADVFVFPEVYCTSPTIIHSLSGGEVILDGGILRYDSSTTGNYIVIYVLDISVSDIFEGVFDYQVPLISIDFISDNITRYKLGPDIPESNLADGVFTLDFISKSIVSKKEKVYVGNSNEIPYQTNSFSGKKLVLPYSSYRYTIPDGCFAGNEDLVEVIIPNSCSVIGNNAFKGCANLQHIYIPETIETIEDGAFDGCIYPELVFEVSPRNRKFVGLTGCLLEKNTDNSYSIVHATSCFFDPASPNYFANCTVCLDTKSESSLFPYAFHLDSCCPWAGMYFEGKGDVTLYNLNGGIITTTAEPITVLDTKTYLTDDTFYVPIYFLIKEIKANACIGDTNIEYLHFKLNDKSDVPALWSLQTIGANAFNGCGNLREIIFPEKTSDYTNYYGWQHSITIGNSAFEKCSRLVYFSLDWDNVIFGDKALFDCTNLYEVRCVFMNQTVSFNSKTGITTYIGTRYYGELWIGNTPNLEVIRSSGGNGTVIGNAYYNSANVLEFGCKGTTFDSHGYPTDNPNCHWIGENAFYGCTDFGTLYTGKLYTIGPSAFYGCTNMTVGDDFSTSNSGTLYICENAFYGCTNVTRINLDEYCNRQLRIHSMAFANSGIDRLFADKDVYLYDFRAKDILEGCVINNVNLKDSESTNDSPYQLQAVQKSVVIKNVAENNKLELLKGTYQTFTKFPEVDAIASNAFDGVTNLQGIIRDDYVRFVMNASEELGSYILANTTVDSQYDNLTKRIELRVSTTQVQCIVNNATYGHGSIALLLKLGGKYFEKIITDTAYNYGIRSQRYYYLNIDTNSLNYSVSLMEHVGGTDVGTGTSIWRIYYDSNGQIQMDCYAYLDHNYANPLDNSSHIHPLSTVTFILVSNGVSITPDKQSKILSPNIVPGSQWTPHANYSINVPNDLQYANDVIYTLNPSEYAFANIPWVNAFQSYNNLHGMKYGFMGCTALTDVDMPSSGFDGMLSEGIFDGCTSLRLNFDSNDVPVEYEDYCLRNTDFRNDGDALYVGNKFGAECFANTDIDSFTSVGIEELDTTAFNSNDIIGAKTFGYSGKYFSGGNFGNSIYKVGSNNDYLELVVGTQDSFSNIDAFYNIGENAFRGNKYHNAQVSFHGGSGRNIYANAFSGSDIVMFNDAMCDHTTIYDSAFENCTNLQLVEIGYEDTIHTKAFSGCTALEALHIPAGTAVLYSQAFKGCTMLQDTTQFNPHINIPVECFSGCTSLESFSTRANIINGFAFEGCTHLQHIELAYGSSDSPTIVGSAFKDCPLDGFKSDDTFVTAGNMIIGMYSIYEIGDDITLVAGARLNGAHFYDELTRDDNNITRAGGSIKVIGNYAYCGRGLEGDIEIPDTVTRIGDYAFANNPGITSVIIPSTVKYIGNHAFDGCTNIDYFTLPDSCTYLGEAALKGCRLTRGFNCNALDGQLSHYFTPKGIESGVISEFDGVLDLTNNQNIEAISSGAFASTKIRVVKLPLMCRDVLDNAFIDCQELVELVINHNCMLAAGSFYGCTKLKDIWLGKDVYEIDIFDAGSLYAVGGEVDMGKKILHAPATLQDNSHFTHSEFYRQLTDEWHFTVDWYPVS